VSECDVDAVCMGECVEFQVLGTVAAWGVVAGGLEYQSYASRVCVPGRCIGGKEMGLLRSPVSTEEKLRERSGRSGELIRNF